MNTSLSITIDEELKDLLPPLDPETYRLLEENILEHGLREPLVLWKSGEDDAGILIDGHNRYAICTEHDIPFRTVFMEFASREEAIIWMINTQIARRNLAPMQLSYFRGLHYMTDKQIQGHYQKGQNDPFASGPTAKRLSDKYQVSVKTIKRDAKLAEGIDRIGETSPEIKRNILSGEVSFNKSKLETLGSAPTEEIEALVAQIEDETYVRRAPRSSAASAHPEISQLNTIIKDFASNFNAMFRKLDTGGPMELKPVLRSYIDRLEDLYRDM